MPTALLIRWSGLATICAGALYALGAMLHPVGEDFSAVTSPNWIPAHVVYWVSVVLMHFSLIGLYTRQATKAGWLGLISFVLALIGTTFVASIFVMATVAPLIATEAPALLAGAMTLPGMSVVVLIVGFGLGYILFGAAIMRAGVLPRWSGLLLIIGVSLFMISEAVPFETIVSHVIVTVGDVLFGLGLAWAGYAIWSEDGARVRFGQREHLVDASSSRASL